MTLIEYLRDIGKHFSVNAMLAKESVQARLESEQGISYTEFSYMILQAIDFLHLFDDLRLHGAGRRAPTSGATSLAGVDLIRRVREAHVHALTVPLITSATGAKFGKSEGNALYLDPGDDHALRAVPVLDQHRRPRRGPLPASLHLPAARRDRRDRARAGGEPRQPRGQRLLAFEVTKLIHGEATVARGGGGV